MPRTIAYRAGGFTNCGISYTKFSQEELAEMKDRVMTENEALKYLKSSKRKSNMLEILPGSDIGNSIIKALEEIQQYRAIGTVEELQDMKNNYFEALSDWRQYRKVGTLEECRAAVEKQTARKGIREKIKKGYNRGMHHYYCPVCYEKGDLRNKYNVGLYCSDCGQKLDWEDEE